MSARRSVTVVGTPGGDDRRGQKGENGVGVGAERRGASNVNGHACAALMKSVSIFLSRGRNASVVLDARNTTDQSTPKPRESQQKRRKRMADYGGTRNSAYVKRAIESLKKRTRFSRVELEGLCKFYKRITSIGQQQVAPSTSSGRRTRAPKMTEGIDRPIFRELLHNTFNVLTEDALVERMFCCWDRESEGAIRLEPWIVGLDVFLKGSLHDRMTFCFRVYDLNNDGFITKDEIFQLFKNCLIKQPGEEDPDEGVRDLTELALKKLDNDRDGKISFRDYETVVTKEPLLLEVFGECLPTEENTAAFLSNLKSR